MSNIRLHPPGPLYRAPLEEMVRMLASLALMGAATAAPLFPQNDKGGKNWVILVAGSNTYDNYRHQSDV